MPDPAASLLRVRVWDLPTRLFHWLLVACVTGAIVSAKIGGDAMPWHARFGYAAGALLLFRVTWGIVGGRWSRFASFVPSPRAVARYVRASGDSDASIGHNPLGAVSVIVMLVVLIVQVATGLFSISLEEFAGPLNASVSDATAKSLTRYHKGIGQPLVIAMVCLHIAAILFYQWRRQNLLTPMWWGDKWLPHGTPASRDDGPSRLLALVLLILFSAVMAWIARMGGS